MPRQKKYNPADEESLWLDTSTDDILAKLPEDQRAIKLFRVKEIGKPPYITSLLRDEFDLDMVQEIYGGGRYRIEFIDPDTNQKIVRQFEIEGQPKILQSNKPNPLHRENGTFRRVEERESPNSEIVDAIRELREEMKKSQEGGITRALVEALLQRDNHGSGGIKETIEMIGALKGIITPPGNIESSVIKEAMMTGMNLVADGMDAANGGKSSPWLALAEKALPALLGLLTRVPLQNYPPEFSRPIDNTTNPSIEVKPVVTEKSQGFQTLAPKLKVFLPTFLTAASTNTDPNSFVETILDSTPTDNLPSVLEWLSGSTWFSDLISLDPAIEYQSAWWAELRSSLIGELSNPEKEPIDEKTD